MKNLLTRTLYLFVVLALVFCFGSCVNEQSKEAVVKNKTVKEKLWEYTLTK